MPIQEDVVCRREYLGGYSADQHVCAGGEEGVVVVVVIFFSIANRPLFLKARTAALGTPAAPCSRGSGRGIPGTRSPW